MPKRLIVINGTMGVGKTTVSQMLKNRLNNAVFLDGDWCWDASPFIVTEETKEMVIGNIAYLLKSFLTCKEYENVIFCWVMNKADTFDKIAALLPDEGYEIFRFTLTCSSDALKQRIDKDTAEGVRAVSAFERSVMRLTDYDRHNTKKIDVSSLSAAETAEIICANIYRGMA